MEPGVVIMRFCKTLTHLKDPAESLEETLGTLLIPICYILSVEDMFSNPHTIPVGV